MTENNSPTTNWEDDYKTCPRCGSELVSSIGTHDYSIHFTYKCHTKAHLGMTRKLEALQVFPTCKKTSA